MLQKIRYNFGISIKLMTALKTISSVKGDKVEFQKNSYANKVYIFPAIKFKISV